MACSTKIKIGSSMLITVTGKDEMELIQQASFFGELPCECGRCKSQRLAFRFRQTKDYDFYELLCKDCEATFALGQKKDGGLYPRGDKETGEWNEKYVADDRGGRGNRGHDDDRRGGRTERQSYREPQGRSQGREGRGPFQEHEKDEDDIPF